MTWPSADVAVDGHRAKFDPGSNERGQLDGIMISVLEPTALARLKGLAPPGRDSPGAGDRGRGLLTAPDVTAAQAMSAAERMRLRFAQLCFPDLNLRLTASFGVATFEPPAPEMALADLLAAADRALYQVKQAGRDCVRARCRGRGSRHSSR